MSDNQGDTRSVTALKAHLSTQSETVSKMRYRISSLSDEIASLRSEINNFKKFVTDDMKRLAERIDGQ